MRPSTKSCQRVAAAITVAVAIGLGAIAPAGAAGSGYDPKIRPKDFVGTIDNPYFPLTPGDRYVYEGHTDVGNERIVVRVTPKTKKVLGVTTLAVRDTAFVNGQLEEDTTDWYAQDRKGNVWYFGEATKEYDAKGKVKSTKGSWLAGVRGAKPGIQMQASPQPGKPYRQEFLRGEAEDFAQVLSANASATVPVGTFPQVVKTKEFTPLEPKLLEDKYYAPGIGLLLEDTIRGGFGRVELVEHTSANSATPTT